MEKNKEKDIDELIDDLKFTDNFTPLTSWKTDVIIKIIDFLNKIIDFIDRNRK